jgi:hypothetical protein
MDPIESTITLSCLFPDDYIGVIIEPKIEYDDVEERLKALHHGSTSRKTRSHNPIDGKQSAI